MSLVRFKINDSASSGGTLHQIRKSLEEKSMRAAAISLLLRRLYYVQILSLPKVSKCQGTHSTRLATLELFAGKPISCT